MLGVALLGDEPMDRTARQHFGQTLEAMAGFAKVMAETVEADAWGWAATDTPPNGNHQFAMSSDGRHLLMNCIGCWDAYRLAKGELVGLCGLKPGEYRVRWYDAMTGAVSEQRVTLGDKPSVVSPGRPWFLYISPVEVEGR